MLEKVPHLNKKRLSADEVIKASKIKDLLFVVKLE
ncbi:MAG: hypothetical protein PWQ76_470 [Clostridiales bacterium]|jgi:hypothetical protein|nr:hypothetical protein [Oscillospiraceae bacterium]MDN5378215.1 hypothetical protein [Clostridiales bacterium]